MTNTNTEWEKSFYEKFSGFLPSKNSWTVREIMRFIRTEKEKSYQEGVAAENNKLAALVGTALHGIELDAMTLHKLNMLFTPTNTV